ncbi:ABC transporter ATP-binding protein [Planotetraspora thailandica]|uniref:ABC transporter ATP-binding protein n=1 Tax=Planotetraspora thailandica TaxID=487172 RepID=A0A8J3V9M3_9ACTN|nr:ABC transporter ATP-binding protein [Planotetraspora thailandica]GII52590.1 ABC transporter ATP-binding protein [Planotetraspora thailandica]
MTLSVKGLTVRYPGVTAVDDLSFDLPDGGSLAVVGESGSGKSTTAAALLGLHRGTRAQVTGTVELDGVDLTTLPDERLRAVRGRRIAMVFQDPLSALDPFFTVGDQIASVYRLHTRAARRASRQKAVEVLNRVGIPDAARRVRAHPHEFSGGMRQRALIAMALALEPSVLVADEPTSALDVTVQAQILTLLADLRAQSGMALLFVTHDLAVAAQIADDVLVMRHGRAVERGPVRRVLTAPAEPYTRELVDAVPRLHTPRAAPEPAAPRNAAVTVHGVSHHYRRGAHALKGISLEVREGETLGIVGESGSGKSTLARIMAGLLPPTHGRVAFDGGPRMRQMVFQDPASSFNPRRQIGASVAEPLLTARSGPAGDAVSDAVGDALERVGLGPEYTARYPHELSGGQRQRAAIARALIARPKLMICDEAVSALDVTTQAGILRLLTDVQRELGLAMVFVSHDLAVVRQVSDRVAVMKDGELVELADAETLFEAPQHPYTRLLLSTAPALDGDRPDSH